MNQAFRGAVDLTGLANKVTKEKLGGNTSQQVAVPALSAELDEQNVRSVIQISSVVPVIVVFYAEADQGSINLKSKLEKLVSKANGTWFLATVNLPAQPALAQAFGIAEAATVAMILAGEPRPLFQGDQAEEDLVTFLEKLIELAKDQGLTGTLVVSDSEVEEEVKLSPAQQSALDAMGEGNYQLAIEIFEKELAANPGNEELADQLAQVKLVARTAEGDIDKELAVNPSNLAEAKRKADYLMAIGDAESAFELLLSFYDQAGASSELTQHLLELFKVAGKNHPAVIKARKDLATKMF
jgi:putative thioredoxin